MTTLTKDVNATTYKDTRMGYLKHNIYTFIYFGKWFGIYVLAGHCLTLVYVL